MRLLLYALGASLFLLSWLLPNHYPPWTTFHSEAAVFAALVSFSLAFAADAQKVCLPRSIAALFAGLIALIWLQWATGLITYGGDALVSSLFIAGVALAWWQGARCALTPLAAEPAVSLAAALLAAAAAISSFIAQLQWLQLELGVSLYAVALGPNMRPYANLAQPNQLATLLLVGTVMAYLLYERRLLKTWQFIVLALYLTVGLVVTESRTGLLSAFVVGLFFLLRGKPGWRRAGWPMVAAWWAVIAVLTKARAPLNEALMLAPPRQVVLAVDDARLVIWKQMLAAIAESPWWGYGWRQTMAAHRHGVESIPGTTPTEYAHNVALDVLAWVGIPLGVLLLLLLAWWLLRTAKEVKNGTELLLLAATLPVLVHSMLEFPFAYAFFLFTTAWFLGALHARQRPEKFRLNHAPSRLVRLLVFGGIMAFALLCAQVAQEYLEAEEDCRVMRFEMRRVGTRPVEHQAPHLVLLTQLDELLQMGRLTPRRGMPPAEIERMRRANMTMDWGSLYLKYVIALGLNGRPDEASRQLQGMRSLYGEKTYRAAVDELQAWRDGKYPELALVKTP